MSQVQETQIEGSPESIEAVATYLRVTLAGESATWASDVGAGRSKVTGAWSGKASDAFATRVDTANKAVLAFSDETDTVATAVSKLAAGLTDAQAKMAAARRTARDGGLTVTGTQIHHPGLAPIVYYEDIEPYSQTPASSAASGVYADKIDTWNSAAEQSGGGYDTWQGALDTFSATWSEARESLTGVSLDLLTMGIEATAEVNRLYQLRGIVELNTSRLVSAERTLAQMANNGKIVVPKSTYYALVDEMDASRSAINAAKNELPKPKVGAKVTNSIRVLGVAAVGYGIYNDMQNGESVAQAATSNIGGFLAGAGAGALIGSFILPPAGTIVGGVIGAGVGLFTSGMIDHLWEDASAGLGDTLEAGLTEIADTGKAIGDLVTGVWDSIF